MPGDLHPTDGARYLLERDGAGEGPTVRYRAAIYTPDTAYTAPAEPGDDGRVELGPTGAPAELHTRLLTMARLVAPVASRRRADGLPPWPHRILRWRR